MKSKKAVVMYSGGKDGYLALTRALDDGAEIAGLLYLDGGRRHFELFHDSRKADLVRELARGNGYRFFRVKIREEIKSDSFLEFLRDFVAENIKGAGTLYMGISDELPEENSMHERMARIFRKRGLRCVFPLLNLTFSQVLAELLRKKVRAVVTGAVGPDSYGYLGKTIDRAFVRHTARLKCDSNYFQTLVIAGPAFGSGLRIKKTRPVDTGEEGRYLELLDWEVG
ncbi:MAG: hypothetical protein AB7V08_03605 [Elusimicrobiales bacterium]